MSNVECVDYWIGNFSPESDDAFFAAVKEVENLEGYVTGAAFLKTYIDARHHHLTFGRLPADPDPMVRGAVEALVALEEERITDAVMWGDIRMLTTDGMSIYRKMLAREPYIAGAPLDVLAAAVFRRRATIGL